jgi:hypothetical protein
MNPTIDKLKLIFLVVFAIGCAASWGYQVLWAWPQRDCEEKGAWWDRSTRTCAAPIYIPALTGRPEGVSRKEWSEKQAAEAVAKGL